MGASITGSVGRHGVNKPDDVRLIQQLLNKQRPVPLTQLDVHGRVGNETLAAIEEFQKRVVKLHRPDGRVDPGGATLKALTSANGAPPPPAAPATPVTITVSHGGNEPTGVIGLAKATDKTTNTRYESAIAVGGGITGQFRCSIYPDNLNVKGRLNDGQYDVYLGFHKPGTPTAHDLVVRTNGFRAVLVVNKNEDVPVTSNDPKKTTSNGIHIHNGYNSWNSSAAMSEGCVILHPADWSGFLNLFLKAYPTLAEWTAGGGRLGKKIGKLVVKS